MAKIENFEWFTEATFTLFARGYERLGRPGDVTLYRCRHGRGVAELHSHPGNYQVVFIGV